MRSLLTYMISTEQPEYRARMSPRLRFDAMPAQCGIHVPRVDCSSIKVGIVDTGAPVHRDIGLNLNSKLVSMVEGCGVFDEDGHGTSVAGVLCGSTFSGMGGLCHESCFHFAKCTRAGNSGDITGIVGSMLWCLGLGCDVVVCSVSTNESEHLASAVVKKLVDKGVVIMCAAPNSEVYSFPAEEPGVIKVRVSDVNKPIVAQDALGGIILPDYVYDVFVLGDRFNDAKGSSFANSFVSGCVVNAICDGAPRDSKGILEYMLKKI
jgi:subtilisin family serine protease